MKVILLSLALISVCYGCNSKKETPSSKNDLPAAAIQIKSALLAAPQEKRDSCTVYGYSSDTQLIILRKGTNELICVADDPKVPEFSVACYTRDLEPFMQRGRELRKQGIKDQSLFDEREKEVNAGSVFLNNWVYEQTKALLEKGKLVALLGGDHSTPLGYYKAIAETYGDLVINKIYAHFFLRESY